LPGQSATSKLDLSLYVYERGDRLEAHFEYATDLFDASTIERMAEQLGVLLAGIVAAPHTRLSDLPLLSDAERRRVIVDWNDTASAYAGDHCIHELFEMRAAKVPDATALVYQGGILTYGELDRRSNQLAHHLRALGVGPEVIVGLSVERSAQMVVGLLGILKAGGAYLPLDPGYPVDRLAYMVADSGTQLLVTAGDGAVSLATGSVRLLRLDAEAEAIARHPITPVRGTGVASQGLVYVLYTSGSTGKPKGVMGTHGAIVNRLHWDATDPSGEETYIQKTTPNFIDMLWEVFMPLMRGQRIAIADEASSRDPLHLIELIGQFKATRIVLVPSLMHAMLESGEDLQSRLPHLRYWACSGEALGTELAALFRERLPNATLYNIYGTSEFWDASWAVADLGDAHHGIPIGRPISNMQAYVLDGGLEPAPIGVGGDLYIGGLGLARGYLKRPDLTAERFVPSPFGNGDRLYRTGDLARWRTDGQLEYLGRVDHQVKLRGFRIELGEIEARLLERPDVHQAVVVAREDVAGDKRLVAYVVAAGTTAINAAELRSHLKQVLPDHMVPSAFVLLDALPLTPNGKVDRRALPAPEGNAVVRGEYVAPQAPVEQVLAEVWRDVLKLDRVGVHDNFFELGGHSLLLTQVHARLVRKLGKEFPIALLFQYPTIRSLSECFSGQKGPAEQMHLSAERGRRRRKSSELRRGRSQTEKRA
jgi:amino acid adenylation domain-containing protein